MGSPGGSDGKESACIVGRRRSEVVQLYPTLCYPVDCSPPGSSVHGILQARVLEWVAISSSRGSSQPRDRTQVSHIAGRCFNLWATREAMWETCVWPVGQKEPLEKGVADNSSILAWRIPWTEEPGWLQSCGVTRVGHDWPANTVIAVHL